MRRLFRNRLDVKNSVAIFRQLFLGPFAALATSLSHFIADRKLASFTTSNCRLYPFYLLVNFTAAIKRDGGAWRLTAERRPTGFHDRVMELFINGRKKCSSIHEYRVLAQDQGPDEYSEAQRERLTNASVDALGDIQDRDLRTKISPHARELREVGIAFMGDYCAIVARQLVRESKDDDWVLQAEYTAAMDESRRAAMYASRSGSPALPVGGSSSVGQPSSLSADEPGISLATKAPSPSAASPPSLSAAGPPSAIRPSSPSAAHPSGVRPPSPSSPHASPAPSTGSMVTPAAPRAPSHVRSKPSRSSSPAHSPSSEHPTPTVSLTATEGPTPAAHARSTDAATLVSRHQSPAAPRGPMSESSPALTSPSV
ncbi:hypothetical protein FA95DRAFT_219295 [Auriscalpium vulgare]|uniref:Uncharacterized protein n=1 Tax=Auriscalpium vulgare TaxID=40419 RepID=A0ACB8RMA9_9AGAM|nr:hypothetical protein FA95DRAFT_219295 [Auriscalpium vulgare]